MKITSSNLKVLELEYKKVGKNSTSLMELKLVEDKVKKNDAGKWEVIGKTFIDGKIWGDKAVEASLEMQQGSILDVSPDIVQNDDDSQWVKYKAELVEDSWEYNGRTYSKHAVNIYDYKIKEFDK